MSNKSYNSSCRNRQSATQSTAVCAQLLVVFTWHPGQVVCRRWRVASCPDSCGFWCRQSSFSARNSPSQRRRNAAGQVVVVQAEDSKRPQMPDLSRNRACQVVPGDVC